MNQIAIDNHFPHKTLFAILIAILAIVIVIRLTTDTPDPVSDKPIDDTTDINWIEPPCSPDELSKDWKEVTHPQMAQNTHRREFIYKDAKWKIVFEKGDPAAEGFGGKDHWHRYNPYSTSHRDLYLDQNGKSVSKNSKPSHILPNCK